jgi:hypothetical protein
MRGYPAVAALTAVSWARSQTKLNYLSKRTLSPPPPPPVIAHILWGGHPLRRIAWAGPKELLVPAAEWRWWCRCDLWYRRFTVMGHSQHPLVPRGSKTGSAHPGTPVKQVAPAPDRGQEEFFSGKALPTNAGWPAICFQLNKDHPPCVRAAVCPGRHQRGMDVSSRCQDVSRLQCAVLQTRRSSGCKRPGVLVVHLVPVAWPCEVRVAQMRSHGPSLGDSVPKPWGSTETPA